MGVTVKTSPPKVKAPKSESKNRKRSEESGQGEAAPVGTNPGGYEEWLSRNTGSYNSSSSNTTLPPIPIEWNISPTNLTSAICPTVGGTIGWFAAADFFSASFSGFFVFIILMCRTFDRKRNTSRGIRETKRLWFTWLIGFTFEALGNLANASIVIKTEYYENLALGHVFLVYSSRPRIKMWFYAIFRLLTSEGEYHITGAYFSMAIVEVMLHIMSAVFVGVTWSRWFLTFLVLAILLAVPIWRRSKNPWQLPSHLWDFVLASVFFGVVYAAPWAYWGMFLQLPGPLFLPAKDPRPNYRMDDFLYNEQFFQLLGVVSVLRMFWFSFQLFLARRDGI
ncbi:hypothetical protein CEP52_002967 [Fusarium oligoseptatum]|uniref:Uncharacterized protein n=1 Tax=Fusarium oligoseptatum TaxID=2604345 RepID=A0A428UB04_9HYPO|nr:hypothetical protein CEP52_002967 [Fusarium oligoseptatum]